MIADNFSEFEIIKRFTAKFRPVSGDLVVPPGDDCAVIDISRKTKLLVTTDMLVEDIHFIRGITSFKDLGWKTVAVNLSDIAAMGGKACHAFFSLAVPGNVSPVFFDEFADGASVICSQYNLSLSGGDITGSRDRIAVNMCVIGEAVCGRYLTRKGARSGDWIQVSGPLGGSAAGLHVIQNKGDITRYPQLKKAHFNPEPRVNVGQALAKLSDVHAMIDVSDGLIQDIGHICHQSRTGAVIHSDDLDCFPEAYDAADGDIETVLNWALCGGEDYELVWTVSSSSRDLAIATALSAGAPAPKTIGRVVAGDQVSVMRNNKLRFFETRGWDHFRS